MKKIIKVLVCSYTLAFGTVLSAQENGVNKGTTTETVVTTIQVDNGDGVKKLTKEITTEKQSALVLDESDKNKLNQTFKEAPVKTTQTTIVKDGDKVVSKDVEVFYTQGTDKYVLEQSENNISYSASKAEIPADAFIIKDTSGDGICYFTDEGKFCVEYRDKTSGTMQKSTYEKEK